MEPPIKPPEALPGAPEPPADGGFPKRGAFRGRGGPKRGGPRRGRGGRGRGGFPLRGGMPMRGPMMRGGPPGRGALRLVAPGGFPPRGRGVPPGRGRMDMGPMREGRGGMFRGRGGHGGPPGRGGPPGGMPRGFGPPGLGGPPRGPPTGPIPRGAVMSRPPRSAPPAPPQSVPPLGGPPERFPPPAGGPPPKRGPPPPAGPPQGPGPAQLVKRPRYETPAYSNGYAPPQSSYSNPPQLDNYSTQGGVAYGGSSTYGTGGQYQASYNNYPPTGSTAYQAGSGAYPSYSTQPGYETTTDYTHNPYPASGTEERYSNQYGSQDYTAYNKPTNPETYSYGGPTAYTAPQGGYDERAYSGVGGAAYDANQVYGGNPATYAAKPEYV